MNICSRTSPGSNRLDNGRALGSLQVLGRASICFCRKTVKGNALLDLASVNNGAFLFPESVKQGFEPFDRPPRGFANTGRPLLNLVKDSFVCTRVVVLGINDEQRRPLAQTAGLAVSSASDDLLVSRCEDVVPCVH